MNTLANSCHCWMKVEYSSFSDHSLICPKEDYEPGLGDNYAINTMTLVDLGYTVMEKDENGNDIPAID